MSEQRSPLARCLRHHRPPTRGNKCRYATQQAEGENSFAGYSWTYSGLSLQGY